MEGSQKMPQEIKKNKKDLSPEQREELLKALKARFEKNRNRRQVNTFFMIVLRRVRKAAEVFATTVQRWNQGKKINPKIAL